MTTVRILGMGKYTPEHTVSNDELATFVDTNDEWIVSRTGVKKRHFLAEGQQNSDMAVEAARAALKDAGLEPSDITHVVVATVTPDMLCPSTACIASDKLGIHGVMSFDIEAACSGFIYGLDVARCLLNTYQDGKVLLICSEALTRRTNWKDRSSCILMGDGAGALVLAAGEGPAKARLLDVTCHSDGAMWQTITVGGGSSKRYDEGNTVGDDFYIGMAGRDTYKIAVRKLTSVSKEILERNGFTLEDIGLFVPHQANLRIMEAVGHRLQLPPEKLMVSIDKNGNTSSATIPIALAEAVDEGRIKPGMLVLMSAFGGGMTWSAGLLQF